MDLLLSNLAIFSFSLFIKVVSDFFLGCLQWAPIIIFCLWSFKSSIQQLWNYLFSSQYKISRSFLAFYLIVYLMQKPHPPLSVLLLISWYTWYPGIVPYFKDSDLFSYVKVCESAITPNLYPKLLIKWCKLSKCLWSEHIFVWKRLKHLFPDNPFTSLWNSWFW